MRGSTVTGTMQRMFNRPSWKPLVFFLLGVVVVIGLVIVALQEFDSRAGDEGGFTSTGSSAVFDDER